MGAPQLIYLLLAAAGFGLELERHGKQKEGKHNAWIGLIAQSIIIGILIWGGFFDV